MVAVRIRPAIVLFGDSITQQSFGFEGNVGWASLLASDYSRRADVLNRGFSGYNTRMGVDLVPKIFGHPPDSGGPSLLFCTVFFGANDAALPGERQHVPIDEYADNLANIVSSIRRLTGNVNDISADQATRIILMTPPPFHAAAWRKARNVQVDDRQNDVAKSYGDKVKQVAATRSCSVLDVWELLEGNTTPEQFGKYLNDGLHLSEDGNRKLHQGLMDLIRKEYPELAPKSEATGIGIPLEEKLWSELC